MDSLLRQAASMKRRTGQVEVESLLTKAMDSVETIKKTGNVHKRSADTAIVKAFKIYQQMQRLCDEPDFFIGTNRNHPGRVVSTARDFGYNYARVHWDAAAMMAVPRGGSNSNGHNPYYNPTGGKRDKNGVLLDLMDSDYWVIRDYRRENASDN